MAEIIKIAGVQTCPDLFDKEQNLERCLKLIKSTADEGARLIIFPEATLTGYVYNSIDEVAPLTETIPGPSTESISKLCRQLNVYVIVGLIEEDDSKFYNAAAFVGPNGIIGKYRKLHLPFLGVDRFLNHGNLPLEVYDTEIGRIGIGICYDMRFPEHSRVLSLLGADIIVIITNWPEGVEYTPEYTLVNRAYENNVFHIAVNRIGEERGVKFFGMSKFVDCTGASLAEGKSYEEDIIYAEINPALARDKHRVVIPGIFEADIIGDRRPEFYSIISDANKDNSRIR